MRSKILEEDNKAIKCKADEVEAELLNELNNKEMEATLLKKENDGFKTKLQKMTANEKALKEEFDSLEEQKYKLDKVVSQYIEEIKEQKNILTKFES